MTDRDTADPTADRSRGRTGLLAALARRVGGRLLAYGGAADATGASTAGASAADPPRVALFVDGPNVLRSEFDVDLDDVRAAATEHGRLAVTRLYVDEHATPGLVQAAEARGYEVHSTSGDVDVALAVAAATVVADGACDLLAIASRDTDFKPVLELAARRGVSTLAIAPGIHGRSDALQNAAHHAVTLDD